MFMVIFTKVRITYLDTLSGTIYRGLLEFIEFSCLS